jgi:hypothetical protein
MKVSRQRIAKATLFLATTVFLSSCNRGYGCPTDFNIDEVVVSFVKTMLAFIF